MYYGGTEKTVSVLGRKVTQTLYVKAGSNYSEYPLDVYVHGGTKTYTEQGEEYTSPLFEPSTEGSEEVWVRGNPVGELHYAGKKRAVLKPAELTTTTAVFAYAN